MADELTQEEHLRYQHDIEGRLLGGILVAFTHSPGRVEPLLDRLLPGHFNGEQNRVIYEAILAGRRAGEYVDLVSLSESLRNAGTLYLVGGLVRLAEMWSGGYGPEDMTRAAAWLMGVPEVTTAGT